MRSPWLTVVIALVALLSGAALFQSSSLAFDYMKLRSLPLYSSAASAGQFAQTLRQLVQDMEPQTDTVKGLIRDRATIAIDIAERNDEAKAAVTDAKVFLRRNLTSQQLVSSKFNDVGLSFTAVDAIFQQYCPPEENDAAQAQISSISSNPLNETAEAGPAAAGDSTPKPTQGSGLSAKQRQAFSKACQIDRTKYCVNERPDPASGERAQMICTQRALQSTIRRKDSVTAFDYESARYLTDTLRITYPNFTIDKVDTAIDVVDEYASLVGLSQPCKPCPATDLGSAKSKGCGQSSSNQQHRKLFAWLWDWLLGWPLALAYLSLAFLFGAIGSLTRYLYAFAAPDEVVRTPTQSPVYPILEGGSAALLVLLLVMAGFQFLTVGASSPDLAYPNPLTVCGLSVLCGLRGDRVLVALSDLLKRILGNAETKADVPAASQSRTGRPEETADGDQ